jgi:CheY-like chemotaxis protein
MSILIVEDNPVNARLLALMLKGQGYQTLVASNGKEALGIVARTPDIQLIITDYMMPEMDGLEFITQVRALPAFNQAPIMIASAHADLETVKRVHDIDCDGFLVKPIDKKELIKRVEYLLKSQPITLLGTHKVMDRLGIGVMEYNELVQTFVAQLTATIPIVALEQEDSDEPVSNNLGRLLKELAESASMLGADKFVLLYAKYKGSAMPARSQCATLLKTIQELEAALLAYLDSQPNLAA